MTETIEVRIPEMHAAKYLPPNMGVCVGGVARKIELSSDDPFLNEIGVLDASFKQQDKAFFTGWVIHRKYTKSELRSSPLVHLRFEKMLESAGEEFGTAYDDSHACDVCGVGSVQVSELCLDTTRIPKNTNITRTLAGEIVVSTRLRDVFTSNGLRGAEFRTVRRAERQNAESKEWFQLIPRGTVKLSPLTRVGNDPFENADAEGCVCGRTLGLNVLSEVEVIDGYQDDLDIFTTSDTIGARRGLLRPVPLVLASRKLFDVFLREQIKRVAFEVAKMT